MSKKGERKEEHKCSEFGGVLDGLKMSVSEKKQELEIEG